MLRAQIEYHAQSAFIGLNYIDSTGRQVREVTIWRPAEDCTELYEDLAWCQFIEQNLENYDAAIRWIEYAKADCLVYEEIQEVARQLEKPRPKRKRAFDRIVDRIMEGILGVPEDDDE